LLFLQAKHQMIVAGLLPCFVFFLVRFSLGQSYSLSLTDDFTSATKIIYAKSGESSFGRLPDSNWDFNHDGFNDILLSSSSNDAAYLFLGGNTLPTSESVKFTGPSNSAFSNGCRFAGDVNNDGYADLIIGAPALSGNSGAAYLVLGGPSTASPYSVTAANARTITFTPEGTGSYFGSTTSSAGDVNKDGFDDFVICATSYKAGSSTNAGACYIIYGGSSLQSISMINLGSGGIKITGTNTFQSFGRFIARAGDINKDGFADILLGNGDNSCVYLVYGGASLTSFTTADSFSGVVFPKPSIGGNFLFGADVSRAGDFNGDGTDDFIISLVGQIPTTPSIIFVVYGSATLPATFDLATLTPSSGVRYFTTSSDNGGVSVSGGVDFNKDGYDDIAIGASNANSGRGAAHIVFGSASPVDSSVFQLGNRRISVNSTASISFGRYAVLTKNVGTNSRGMISVACPFFQDCVVYYLHDFFTPPTPTAAPTFSPSVSPIVEPTFNPSAYPSVGPTFNPSASPSVETTFHPSASPSVSAEPTFSPSVVPSFPPTLVPTMTPTPVLTIVPSFRPTGSSSAIPTTAPTGRSKSSIIINAGFTVNSVSEQSLFASNGKTITNAAFAMKFGSAATLTPTSLETIKQSIANVSQTTVNNVDLLSVTRTDRRLLSSAVVHRMLATDLFSYKVVAEIHFNLIDFPGLNESYVAGTKSKGLKTQ
jgi:hypothetical protein